MKKQLLKTAVVAAIVLPMAAQAGVYGRADGVLAFDDYSVSGQVGGVSIGSASRDAWDVGADKMRWGIVGSEDLGNGMKALYHYEFNMAGDAQGNGSTADMENVRLAYAGLQGNWGKLTIGRNWIQSYFAVWNKTDTGDAHAIGSVNNNLSGNRSGNMLQYTSPNMSGFSVGLDLNIDDQDASHGNSDGVDWYEISAQYKNGPMQLGFAYRDAELGVENCVNINGASITAITTGSTCTEYDQWGIAGSYSFGDLTVEGNYGNRDTDGLSELEIGTQGSTTTIPFSTSDTDVWGIGATYKMGNTHIHGAYRNNDTDGSWTLLGTPIITNGNVETTSWYIGVRHFLSKETRVFAEYIDTETDVSGSFGGVVGFSGTSERQTFAVGLRKDWKL